MRLPKWHSSALILLLHPLVVLSASLTFSVPSNLIYVPASTTATLTTLGRSYTAHLTRSNTLRFTDLEPGSYLLDVQCRDWTFVPLRVDVTPQPGSEGEGAGQDKVEVWQTFRGNEWDNKGELRRERPVQLKMVTHKEYYNQREGFSPLSLLRNPMILLAGVSMLIIFGMPYLLENMDPETRRELEETQRKSPLTGGAARQNPLQGFDMAAWMAGSPSDSSEGAGAGGGGPVEEVSRGPSGGGAGSGRGQGRSGQWKKGR